MCMTHNYGDASRAYSFEYFNFYLCLKQMGHDVELFDYLAELNAHGKQQMNQKLLKYVQETRPDLCLFSLYTDQFEPETVQQLRTYTKTLCFFHDDTWRIDYSRYWAQFFDYFTTTDIFGEIKYREMGLPNAIYFPFGFNPAYSKKLDLPKQYDVSFVGGWHPYRAWLIQRLRDAGIQVSVFGHRWPNGEIDQARMVEVFNQSKINLNLSNSASWDLRYLLSSPKALINRIRSRKNTEQMKARLFEVGGCGAFQLTYFVEGLANCFEIEKEIAVYADADDLISKVQFYLGHDALREQMAAASYQRACKEHTFEQRFNQAFQRMGLIDA